MTDEGRRLVAELNLSPHPEGGWYRETYRSPERVTTSRGTLRSATTAIYYLLDDGQFSAFHRLSSDELWHFYRGDPVAIEVITAAGAHHRFVLGAGGPWQAVIPAGAHFAAHLEGEGAGYALVGCDVAPGFEFADFVLTSRSALLAAYPQHGPLIARWTR